MPPLRHRRYKNSLLKKTQVTEKILKQNNGINNSTCANSHQAQYSSDVQPLILNAVNHDEIYQNDIPLDNWNHQDIQQLDPSIINELREYGKILEVVLSKDLNQPWEKFYKALMEDFGDN